mgnify:CR=1 FL=1
MKSAAKRDATLDALAEASLGLGGVATELSKRIAERMDTAPKNWQWIGEHLSQQHFGITQARAEMLQRMYGGIASPLDHNPNR